MPAPCALTCAKPDVPVCVFAFDWCRRGPPVSLNVRLTTMPRAMSAEREREYEELRAFVDFYCTSVKGLGPASPIHPTNVLKEIVLQYGKSKALEGLRQATNDILEEMSDRPMNAVAAVDSSLQSLGIVTISELRRRYASSYKRVVKRGFIRTQTEYYLVNGIVVDLTSAVTDSERSELQRFLEAYEQSAA